MLGTQVLWRNSQGSSPQRHFSSRHPFTMNLLNFRVDNIGFQSSIFKQTLLILLSSSPCALAVPSHFSPLVSPESYGLTCSASTSLPSHLVSFVISYCMPACIPMYTHMYKCKLGVVYEKFDICLSELGLPHVMYFADIFIFLHT